MYDYGARFYDPVIGRFHTIDPIIELLPYLTPYNYASNNPVTLIDLYGLQGILYPGQREGYRAEDVNRDRIVDNEEAKTGRIVVAGIIITGVAAAVVVRFWSFIAPIISLPPSQEKEPEVEDPTPDEPEPADITEGVYEFDDTDGKDYTGQSEDIPKRLKQHEKSGKKDPNAPVKKTEEKGGKTKRELKETEIIDSKGGADTKKNPNKNVSNKRRPVSKKREEKLKKGGL